MKDIIKVLKEESYTSVSYNGKYFTIEIQTDRYYEITCSARKEVISFDEDTNSGEGECIVTVELVTLFDDVKESCSKVDLDDVYELEQLLGDEFSNEF